MTASASASLDPKWKYTAPFVSFARVVMSSRRVARYPAWSKHSAAASRTARRVVARRSALLMTGRRAQHRHACVADPSQQRAATRADFERAGARLRLRALFRWWIFDQAFAMIS